MGEYTGGCQCGAVRYRVDVDLSQPVTCNCSRCQRLGSVLAFAPLSAFTLEKGEGALSEYLFNKKAIQHLFCKTCGIESFSYGKMPDGTPMAAVNINCLDDVDPREIAKLAYHYDGRAL
ncbi:GFA family protein [Neogemmobacter tilapiae]|uniref:Aldehyde-activating protein n=1 Tax=Neogemmobacter tilapiae TaxID=875041 RepID=A0A918TPK6_9RHOB|nr:GFA family protein [Gemmobacter tilapiae]GHC57891.1 aldehyde-activating protein [Gemmobacter tilapiae]